MTYHHLQVTDREGCLAAVEPVPAGAAPPWAAGVSQSAKTKWVPPQSPERPFFAPPIPFVIPPPEGSDEPFYAHNHCPAIAWCLNGDLLAALSFDEGDTWPARKLLTPGEGVFDGGAWTNQFTATTTQAEPKGYLAATQTPDGIVHLISSRLHYRFNLAWME